MKYRSLQNVCDKCRHLLKIANSTAMYAMFIVAFMFCNSCTTNSIVAIPVNRPFVTVVGAVRNEGAVAWYSTLTVAQAIAIVGGPTSGSFVKIFRSGETLQVDLRENGAKGAGLILESRDVVEVLPSTQALP